MAAHYARIVVEYAAVETCDRTRTRPVAPVLLGGWSFGGVVAFEAARILLAQAGAGVVVVVPPVAGVVLIDAPPPVDHEPLSEEIIHAVTTTSRTKTAKTAKTATATTATARLVRKLVRRSFRSCAALAGAFDATTSTAAAAAAGRPPPPVVLLRSREGWRPPPGHALARANRWVQDRTDRALALDGWERVIGAEVRCVDIPGDHFSVFDRGNVEAVSAAIAEACRELDRSWAQGST